MYNLSNIGPRKGAKKNRKRVGRGAASGWGKTAGKGTKGQKSRSGGKTVRGFEGGQMPLYRRVPKRGFKNPFRKDFVIVNLGDLGIAEAGTVVDREWLSSKGLIPKKIQDGVKVLGSGDVNDALTVKVERISKSAQAKIEAAGGSVELI